MSEMVDRVAEAIADAIEANSEADSENFMEALSRAAIGAMKLPTKKMIIDGNYEIDDHIDFYNYESGAGYPVEPQAAVACWSAMIDTALGPVPD